MSAGNIPQEASLLGLPGELRNRIYVEVLAEPKIVFIYARDEDGAVEPALLCSAAAVSYKRKHVRSTTKTTSKPSFQRIFRTSITGSGSSYTRVAVLPSTGRHRRSPRSKDGCVAATMASKLSVRLPSLVVTSGHTMIRTRLRAAGLCLGW